jgi:ribosome biogenesis GTPase A
MTKARRMIAEQSSAVDIICEVADARIPLSSRNPDLDELTSGKPRLIILNRIDLADSAETARWVNKFKAGGLTVLECDAKSGKGTDRFEAAVRSALAEKIDRWKERGMGSRPIKAMIAGIPNVGKSSFINKVARRKAAIASDRPGVTRGRQWVTAGKGLELLDTPGILWPKIEHEWQGENLAFTGAIKDAVTDVEAIAVKLFERLEQTYPELLATRYKLDLDAASESPELRGYELLSQAARKRGFRISGGEFDTLRMANIALDEFRAGTIGRITLERAG